MFKLCPIFDYKALTAVLQHSADLRAIVLELYGTGNCSSRRKDFLDFLQARETFVPESVIALVGQSRRLK